MASKVIGANQPAVANVGRKPMSAVAPPMMVSVRRNWPQAAIFGNLGENRAGPQQTGQESPRSYMERRSKSSEGFIGWWTNLEFPGTEGSEGTRNAERADGS